MIKKCLALLCDPADAERHFVEFEDDDSVVLVVNNYGGISNLELGALTDEILIQLCTPHTHQILCYTVSLIVTISARMEYQACQNSQWSVRNVTQCTRLFHISLQSVSSLKTKQYISRRVPRASRRSNHCSLMAKCDNSSSAENFK